MNGTKSPLRVALRPSDGARGDLAAGIVFSIYLIAIIYLILIKFDWFYNVILSLNLIFIIWARRRLKQTVSRNSPTTFD